MPGRDSTRRNPGLESCLRYVVGHPENLELGYYVMSCIGELGVPWTRIADGRSCKGEPHGSHRWQSYFSEAVEWFHLACLGLGREELTSYTAVRMHWLLSASRAHRLWFLRGIADSDGTVNIKNRSVVLTTHPNGRFFLELFESLGLPARLNLSDGEQYVSIRAKLAMQIQIFNPEIETHRSTLLVALATARAYERRWPTWLETEASKLAKEGLSASEIRNRILFQFQTYVKLETIRSRMRQEWSRRRDLSARPSAYETAEPT